MSQVEFLERDRVIADYKASLTTAGLATLVELLRYRDWRLSQVFVKAVIETSGSGVACNWQGTR